MADLLVVTGPPGTGKSTVAALLLSRCASAALVPGDAFFAFWSRGAVAPWLPEAHAQNEVVLRAAAAAAGSFAAGGCTVVHDGVVGPWSLPLFTAAARAAGAVRLHYAVLLPPLDRCLARVAARTGHGFTDLDAAAHMHADFARADVEARHVITDALRQPEDVAEEVLGRWDAGELQVSR